MVSFLSLIVKTALLQGFVRAIPMRKPVVVEVLVEDPSNERDRALIELVKRVASAYEGQVEIRIFTWAGPHEHAFSLGVLDAYKMHACPAVVVNGFIVAAGRDPTEQELREAIEKALRTGEFRISRCL